LSAAAAKSKLSGWRRHVRRELMSAAANDTVAILPSSAARIPAGPSFGSGFFKDEI
jgi:hypothetical protein